MGTFIVHCNWNYCIHINDIDISHLWYQNLGFVELLLTTPIPRYTISSCCIHTISLDFPKRRTTTYVESHEDDYLVFGVSNDIIYLTLCRQMLEKSIHLRLQSVSHKHPTTIKDTKRNEYPSTGTRSEAFPSPFFPNPTSRSPRSTSSQHATPQTQLPINRSFRSHSPPTRQSPAPWSPSPPVSTSQSLPFPTLLFSAQNVR